MNKNYYELLELDKNATKEQIKKQYFKFAKLYHPDHNKNPDAEERFKEINEAYQVLYNETSRAQYDEFLDSSNSKQIFQTQEVEVVTPHEIDQMLSNWNKHDFSNWLNNYSMYEKLRIYEYIWLSFWYGSDLSIALIKENKIQQIYETFISNVDMSILLSISKSINPNDFEIFDQSLKNINNPLSTTNKTSRGAYEYILNLIEEDNVFDSEQSAIISLLRAKEMNKLFNNIVDVFEIENRKLKKAQSNKGSTFGIVVLIILIVIIIGVFVFWNL